MAELTAGQDAPPFELQTDGGGMIRLAELRGKFVVLFFYPQDNTETCTIEAIDFSALNAEFAALGAVLVGISPDSRKKHDNFKAKHGLAMTLGSDPERQAIDAYGVWGEKTMFGRKYMGVVRSTFLVDREGRIARIWPKVRVPGHAAEVLETVRGLAH